MTFIPWRRKEFLSCYYRIAMGGGEESMMGKNKVKGHKAGQGEC